MAQYVQTVKYTLDKGYPWERLIMVKNRYNRRVIKPTDCRAYIKTGTLSKFEITASITTENGILLSLTGEETQDLPEGILEFDVIATVEDVQRPVVKGTIEVVYDELVTPLEDTQAMEIRFKKYTDFRQSYTWKDSDGVTISVTDAFMQAKDSSGATVLDLRWYSSTPSDATVIALSPANKRGYIAPKSGYTLEIHISDTNSIPSGSYQFDLFVKDAAGDWSCISSGTLVVEAAVSVPPA
jgi:hypothetical protein